MKKLLTIFALLCMSAVGWATQYCNTVLSELNAGETNGQTLTFTASKTGELETTFTLTSATSTLTGLYEAVFQINGGGVTSTNWSEWNISAGTLSKVVTWTTYPSNSIQLHLVAYRDNSGGGSNIIGKTITDIDVSASCGGGSSKADPELSLNATTKTLQIDASAETFQIVASKAAGSGAISYESSDNSIATVSNTGLITAVGAGTATITVSVAENEDFDTDSKTITVDVIDWPNTGWLTNSSNTYKLHISPAIGDQFGGKRIEGSNLWVGFPSADFGACSIEYSASGAGVSFPLNQFTKHINQFTMVCGGTTYTFTVYRLFDGVNLAKNMSASAGVNASNAGLSNNGNIGDRWGSSGAKHYATVGDMTEDWWYVDLGAVYSVEQIKILFERACATDYDLQTSPNGESWVNIGSSNAQPKTKEDNDGEYQVYDVNPAKNARYVRIFTRNGYNNLAYGFSMYEFEVYGQPAENVDVNAPVLSSAAVSGTPTTTEIKIAVSATDTEDGSISLFRVRESSLGIDHNYTAVDGKLTFGGLYDDTDCSFTITALDAMGNQSNAIVVNASTATDPANPATMATTPPSRSADDVRAIYSDAYPVVLAHDFIPERIDWGSVSATRRVKNGNNYLLYDVSSGNNITWGSNDGGADAIVAKDGYHAADKTGLDANEMEYLHVDIWSLVALTNLNVRINDALFTTITHDGSGWQSYDLEMDGSSTDFTNIRWLKFDGITGTGRQKVAIDNYYFWKAPSGVKAVVVSTNNGSWGTATAKVGDDDVTSVATGTEVTFNATPNSGYDFAYWAIGETKVYDNPYVVAVDANISATATFEPSRTAFCAEPVTNAQGHTIYLTVNKTANANEYRILFEGSSNTHITNSHGNIQFRLTHVNGSDGEHHFAGNEWTVDATGFGSIYTTFTATDFRAITITNRYIPLTTSNSAADEFNFPTSDATIIKWDATCSDDEAPVLAAPVATPLSGTTVRLAMSATDNMAALLTYSINYKPVNDAGAGTDVEAQGTAGEITYKNIKNLSAGVKYQFTVTVSDGTNESAPQVCYATPSMPTAPVPVHNADLVRSVYSDKYEPALAHDFRKNTWADAHYSEQNIGGDNLLVYVYEEGDGAQMRDVAWGVNNDGAEAIIAKDGFNDGTNKGLDVRPMAYLHFDMWSAIATIYPEVYLNDTKLAGFQLDGSGWQSFDIPLSSLTDDKKNNVRWMKFIALRTPNPEEIAIDNVYFWQYGVQPNQDNWASFASADNIRVPNDVTVYTANYSNVGDDEQLILSDAGKVIPANTGVMLRATALTTFNFTIATQDEADSAADNFANNDLVGCAEREDISNLHEDYDIFCMRRSELYGFTGFFLYTGQYIPAGKAYLPLLKQQNAPAPAARRVRLVFDTATGVDNTENVVKVSKCIENGQIYIIRDGIRYTATGLRVE